MRPREEKGSRGEHQGIPHKRCSCCCISGLINNDMMTHGYIKDIVCFREHSALFAAWYTWIAGLWLTGSWVARLLS